MIYPLRFREILRSYDFGERWIPEAFPAKGPLPAEGRVTETWEVCDRPKGSSEILNGPLAGRTLRQAIEALGADLLGTDILERFGGVFPLLIKFLDVTNPLVEQSHESDELVRRRGGGDYFGKTEAWHVLRVRPGARVQCGLRPEMTREKFEEALQRAATRECMREYTCAPGDTWLLYAGTVHAATGGALLYEIMQNSDVFTLLRVPRGIDDPEERREAARSIAETVDLDDRTDRKIHPLSFSEGHNQRIFVLACDHFVLERLELAGDFLLSASPRRFRVLTAVEGEVDALWAAGGERLTAGQSILLPAAMPDLTLRPRGQAALLAAYTPDLVADVIEPLRQRGFPASAIARLGGKSIHNPLFAMLGVKEGERR
ncbi:MAG: hypothetical protein NTW86_04830 [Candidatus Sumerlaeota bacterium]|nr:hypothetical protein [Candidatus Sumerlaeota bacterium]